MIRHTAMSSNARRAQLAALVAVAVLLPLLGPGAAAAQFVPRPKLVIEEDSTVLGFAGGERRLVLAPGIDPLALLQSASLDLNNAAPRANIAAVEYMAQIAGRYYPFYVFTSFPVLMPDREDLEEYVANEILNQFGGLLNITMERQWYYAYSENRPGHDGLIFSAVAGGKLLEVAGISQNEYTPTMHAGASAQLRFFFNEKETNDLAGLVHIRASVLANYVSGNNYTDLFSATGAEPGRLPLTFSVLGSFHLLDQFSISGGMVASAEDRLPGRKYLAVTMNRR